MVAKIAALAMPGTTGELDGKSFSHEIRTIFRSRELAKDEGGDIRRRRTESRNNIAGIHWVLVLDETEAVHELHFGDFSSAMSREVSLDVGFGSCWAAGQWFD
jgi:hypothetical protein